MLQVNINEHVKHDLLDEWTFPSDPIIFISLNFTMV